MYKKEMDQEKEEEVAVMDIAELVAMSMEDKV